MKVHTLWKKGFSMGLSRVLQIVNGSYLPKRLVLGTLYERKLLCCGVLHRTLVERQLKKKNLVGFDLP